MIYAMEATLPTSLWGWVAIIGVIVTVTSIVLTTIIALARAHINRRIELTLEEQVDESVDEALKPIEVKIDTLSRNAEEATLATMSGIRRIEALEVTINNGLTHATEKNNADIGALATVVGGMQLQLSEMHGWMKAQNAAWDGATDRRA